MTEGVENQAERSHTKAKVPLARRLIIAGIVLMVIAMVCFLASMAVVFLAATTQSAVDPDDLMTFTSNMIRMGEWLNYLGAAAVLSFVFGAFLLLLGRSFHWLREA